MGDRETKTTDFIIPLIYVLAAIGIPIAGATFSGEFVDLLAQNPLLALGVVTLYGVMIVLFGVAIKVWQRLEPYLVESTVSWIEERFNRSFSGYRKRYFEYLVYRYRDFDVKGLSTQGLFTLMSEDVFVDLKMKPQALHQISSDPLRPSEALREEKHNVWAFLSGEQMVDQNLAILGPPGSGKTTLLKHITLTLINRRKGERHGAPDNLPILLFLRHHAKTINENPTYSLAQVLHDALEMGRMPEPPPRDWFEKSLLKGKCLIMLDGLDEVADREVRQRVATWVEQQMNAYSNNRFVITSRPFGYRSNPLSGVTVLEMQPFTNEQVHRFVERWYLANEIMSFQQDDHGVRLKAQEGAEELIKRIRRQPTLSALAVNPLLLTMIATIHCFRSSLPERRVELYAEIFDVFLPCRTKPHSRSGPGEGRVRAVLRPLAYHMMTQQQREIKLDEALQVIYEPLYLLAGNQEGEAFLKRIEHSSGLLLERENGLYSFAHLSFQEYLAALHIREQGGERVLVAQVEERWWHETIRLYCAQADATSIIAACLESDHPSTITLAGDCLNEASQWNLKLLLDRLLQAPLQPKALEGMLKMSLPEQMAATVRGLEQLWNAANDAGASVPKLRQALTHFGALRTQYHEIVVFLELSLFSLECEALSDFSTPAIWQALDSLRGPFLLENVVDFGRQLRHAQDQIEKGLSKTNSQEQQLLLAEVLNKLVQAKAVALQQLSAPYQDIAQHVSDHWHHLVRATLESLRGRALLRIRLISDERPFGQSVDVGLELCNMGDQIAEQVTLSVSDSSDVEVLQADPPLDYLPPRECTTWRCVLKVLDARPISLHFSITYRQGGLETLHETEFADVLTFFALDDKHPFQPLARNPYVTGGPLQTDDLFFGREDLIEEIARDLQGKYQDNIIVLYGQRRTGKTSVLYALQRKLPKTRYIPVFYDAQGISSLRSLFLGLAYAIYDACEEEGIVLPEPTRDEYASEAQVQFEYGFLRQVRSALGPRRLLLMIDEFESLEQAVKNKQLPQSIFPFFRHLMQHQQQLSFIFCGTHRLHELTHEYWEIFFNAALPRQITFLNQNATSELIQKPVQGHFTYDELALNHLLSLTGGHPYFTQLLCHRLVRFITRQKCGYVTRQMVEDAARQLVRGADEHLQYIWKQSNSAEQALLLALVKERQDKRQAKVLWADVEARLSEEALGTAKKARSELVRRELVNYDKVRIGFTMGLIAEWLIAHYLWSNLKERQ